MQWFATEPWNSTLVLSICRCAVKHCVYTLKRVFHHLKPYKYGCKLNVHPHITNVLNIIHLAF